MKRFIMLLILAFALSGCSTLFDRGNKDWYSGPAELKPLIQDDINAAIHHLQIELGRPLKWRWDKDSIRVNVINPAGHIRGVPYVIAPGNIKCYGYYLNGTIVIPQGYRRGTAVHECGHAVLRVNGYPDTGAHHGIAPKFFKQFSGAH